MVHFDKIFCHLQASKPCLLVHSESGCKDLNIHAEFNSMSEP